MPLRRQIETWLCSATGIEFRKIEATARMTQRQILPRYVFSGLPSLGIIAKIWNASSVEIMLFGGSKMLAHIWICFQFLTRLNRGLPFQAISGFWCGVTKLWRSVQTILSVPGWSFSPWRGATTRHGCTKYTPTSQVLLHRLRRLHKRNFFPTLTNRMAYIIVCEAPLSADGISNKVVFFGLPDDSLYIVMIFRS